MLCAQMLQGEMFVWQLSSYAISWLLSWIITILANMMHLQKIVVTWRVDYILRGFVEYYMTVELVF